MGKGVRKTLLSKPNPKGSHHKKTDISYVEVKAEVVVKVGEEFVVQARVQILVRRVDGWMGGRIKQN